MRRCSQIKCFFYIEGNCQSCQRCGSKPYELEEECDDCLSCEGDEGELRWGRKDSKAEVKKVIKIIN